MTECLIGLGSNLGDRQRVLDRAILELGKKIQVKRTSRWYSYPAIGPTEDGDSTEQPEFLNGAVLAETDLSAFETASILHELEASAGRERVVRWSARTLDADLLLFGDEIVHSERLTVPHPRMVSRHFVLEPAADVAPKMVHPQIGWTMEELFVHLLNKVAYFAIIGSDKDRATELCKKLSEEFDGKLLCLAPTASSTELQLLECAAEKLAFKDPTDGPWFSDFWLGQGNVDSSLSELLLPKALLVLDSPNSEFAKRLQESPVHVPVVFLSPTDQHAWQDAVGAVQGMWVK